MLTKLLNSQEKNLMLPKKFQMIRFEGDIQEINL